MSFNNFDDSENLDINKGKVLNDSNSSKIDALIDKMDTYMENQE